MPAVEAPRSRISIDGRRELARGLLDTLTRHGIQHMVLRDPERLLSRGLGDLDLWVSPPSIEAAHRLLHRRAEEDGWNVVKEVIRPYARSLYLYRPDHEASALTVDVFPAIRWYVLDVVPAGEIRALALDRSRRVGDESEAVLATLHHLAWSREVPPRYAARLHTAAARPSISAEPFARAAVAARSPVHTRLVRRHMLRWASAQTLAHRPYGAVRDVASTLVSLLRSTRGRLITIDDAHTGAVLLEELKRQHFLVGRWGKVTERRMGPARTIGYWIDHHIKVRLGATLIAVGPARSSEDVRIETSGGGWTIRSSSRASFVPDLDGLATTLIDELGARTPIDRPPPRHPGAVIGIVGPDGAGKTTLVDRLQRARPASPIDSFHWRPGVLPPLFRLRASGPRPAPSDPRPGVMVMPLSVARLLYYWLDTQLGFMTRWGAARRAGRTVVVERTFLDVAAHPERYAFQLPRRIIDLAVRCSFKPDLVIVLDVDGDVATQRKEELSAEEADRQLAWWRGCAAEIVDVRMVDASPPINDVAARIADIVFNGT